MGYLTPILFRNDSGHMLNKSPDEVIQAIKRAMMSHEDKSYSVRYVRKRKWYQFWKPKKTVTGVDCNPIEALGTRHADQDSVIVLSGNTWIDLSKLRYGSWDRNDATYIKYVEDCIKIAQRHLTDLKKVVKERKNTE